MHSMTKKTKIVEAVCTFILAVWTLSAFADYESRYQYSKEKGDIGFGATLGPSLGISASYAWSSTNTIEAAVAMEMKGVQNIRTWADYLWVHPSSLEVMSVDFGWFWGGGVGFRTENDPDLEEEYLAGPRLVGGLTKSFDFLALELVGQLSYTQYLTQITKGEPDISIGLRYYF
ncbi:MAG: hypothetical protein IPL83_01925 [Bdellovibrionales bacterium]|nr:hypothetical protein [Bdellovibrionales bacterium]